MKPLPTYGEHMTLSEYLDCVHSECFVDYDGHGVLATSDAMSDIEVWPSDDLDIGADATEITWHYAGYPQPMVFTHIVWFNR